MFASSCKSFQLVFILRKTYSEKLSWDIKMNYCQDKECYFIFILTVVHFHTLAPFPFFFLIQALNGMAHAQWQTCPEVMHAVST